MVNVLAPERQMKQSFCVPPRACVSSAGFVGHHNERRVRRARTAGGVDEPKVHGGIQVDRYIGRRLGRAQGVDIGEQIEWKFLCVDDQAPDARSIAVAARELELFLATKQWIWLVRQRLGLVLQGNQKAPFADVPCSQAVLFCSHIIVFLS